MHTRLEVGKDASQVLVGRSAELEGRRWMVQGRMGHGRDYEVATSLMRQEDYCMPVTHRCLECGQKTSADHGTAVESAATGYGHKYRRRWSLCLPEHPVIAPS